jgi:hypothetical protein
MIVVEALQSQNPQEFLFPTAMRIVGSTTLFVLALSASLFEMRIPSDAGWDTTSYMVSHAHTNYLRSTEMIWKAFVPIPRMSTLNFWNTNLLDNYHGLMTVFSLVLLCVSVSLFIRNRTVLFLYLSGLGSLLVFKQLFYFGTLRHDGQAFILFLASAWLLGTYTGGLFPSTVDNRTGLRGPLYRNVVFTGLLAIQAFLGLLVSSMALQLPFSQARATADFIRAKHMDQMLIVGDPDYAVSPIAGFLGREIYYRRGNRMGSYVIWDKARPVSPEESMFEVARHLATDQHQNVLLILTQIPNHSVQEIASFTGSIVRDERYYLYVVKPAPI